MWSYFRSKFAECMCLLCYKIHADVFPANSYHSFFNCISPCFLCLFEKVTHSFPQLISHSLRAAYFLLAFPRVSFPRNLWRNSTRRIFRPAPLLGTLLFGRFPFASVNPFTHPFSQKHVSSVDDWTEEMYVWKNIAVVVRALSRVSWQSENLCCPYLLSSSPPHWDQHLK